MNEPLISIVIPCYNIEAYIDRTLDSVFGQTYPNLEVIAVDDGSQDGTGAVLDRYAEKEPRLHVLHQKNRGVSYARLNGVAASSGEYIGFVDGDDLIDPDMYERLYQNAVHYKADISHCGYRMVFPDRTDYYYNTGETVLQNRKRGISDLLEGTSVEPGLWNKLFRRELFVKLLQGKTVMDLTMRENEDLLMNYCLFSESAQSVYEDFCPYQYLIRNSSSSQGGLKPHILTDPIHIGELLLEETKQDPDWYRLAARYYVTKLIKAATVRQGFSFDKMSEIRKAAHEKLTAFLPEYRSLPGENAKRKLMAAWAAYAPHLYSAVHQIYSLRN